ncbi:hypothetical protein GCM10017655_12240 [Pseudomonas turukhanskensis]|uniref:Uncharacterized protein n=1 Tax=Pseudomonas turukhanskensis TaxID=1806536 RepID=A0A9W6K3F8_9PSED|nr:hypothetical protein GCM10017655_12240 [Pseudomonas turukhanskensis]
MQAGASGGAGQQLRAQALGRQRQAGGEHGAADGLLVQGAKRQQAIEQRVVMLATGIMVKRGWADV